MNDADRAALIASARRVGADPLDYATVMSYETGGRMDPSIRGGAGNRHIGLIQFGPAEAQRYGASQDQSFADQLPAVEAYLTDRGFKPGMSRLDLYSTINAGQPGRYTASDAGNGGAPGTVADKVNDQMGAHEAKARALLGDAAAAPTMTTPGEASGLGAFGLSGPTQAGTPFSLAPAGGAAMASPAAPPAADDTASFADLLKSLGGLSGSGQQAQPAAGQQHVEAAPQLLQPRQPRAAQFDPTKFFSLLPTRRATA